MVAADVGWLWRTWLDLHQQQTALPRFEEASWNRKKKPKNNASYVFLIFEEWIHTCCSEVRFHQWKWAAVTRSQQLELLGQILSCLLGDQGVHNLDSIDAWSVAFCASWVFQEHPESLHYPSAWHKCHRSLLLCRSTDNRKSQGWESACQTQLRSSWPILGGLLAVE